MLQIFSANGKTVTVDEEHNQITVECEDRGVGVYEYDPNDRHSFATAMRDAMNELTA